MVTKKTQYGEIWVGAIIVNKGLKLILFAITAHMHIKKYIVNKDKI